ncbi:hypothetical protein Psuf_032600 [Phytohabitans suffuscus]|uniref:Uncharacterized protein n=1 Tax=Phytohabitans suffuscus TaxID=624315 RepID=A0A6F8YIQ3_9ACTN|nr:hypothetical protein [Phytohabitans suffuscus]BCB85947.1 hypothetical protein Psuf_032600 [Phytohabitans suffuscus]
MPVPDALRTLSHDPAFWADYFFRATPAADPDPADLRATFPIAGGYALVLDLDREYGTYALGLRTPGGSEPIPMAWDDRSRWHPHGLLWPELDLIGRVVALDDPSLPHPGLPVALLCRFAPITPEDDAAAVRDLLGAALRSLRVPVPPAEQEPLFPYSPRVLTEEQVADYLQVPGEGWPARCGTPAATSSPSTSWPSLCGWPGRGWPGWAPSRGAPSGSARSPGGVSRRRSWPRWRPPDVTTRRSSTR